MPPKSSTASIQPVNFFCFVRGRGGQWIRKSPGTFWSQTQRDRQTNKTETKTFSQLLLIFIKKLLDGNFHQLSEKFLWHRKQEMLQFSGVFTVTNIISIRWNRSSFPCVYLWRWMPEWQEIDASWKKLNWGMPSLYIGRKWLTLKYPWCWTDQRRSLRRHIFMSGLSSNGSIAWNIWEVVEIRWGSNEGPKMQFPSRVGLETLRSAR